MKRFFCIVLAALIAAALAGCSGGGSAGPVLSHNIARLYFPDERVSRFVLDGGLIEGSVPGKALMDTSADGRTSLAWVDTAVSFVSAEGAEALGTGISAAEISFDGRKAVWLDGNELKLYSAETRKTEVIASGVEKLTQAAISPQSECMAFTLRFEGEDADVCRLFRAGELTELLPDERATVLAVSDDGSLVYYLVAATGEFRVRRGEESVTVFDSCGGATNYNFTNDLKEAAFNGEDGVWRLWRLEDGSLTELGGGFQFTLKTDIYSMNLITAFVYINDVETFTNGLWLKRVKANDSYEYTVCFMDGKGDLRVLAENADAYAASPDGSCVYYTAGGELFRAKVNGGTERIASMVNDFCLTEDGKNLYFIDGASEVELYTGSGRPERVIAGEVSSVSAIGSRGLCIKADGTLWSLRGAKTEKLLDNASYMDKRSGQLMVYADETEVEGASLYSVYFTTDGASLSLLGERVMP
ncbi:MAG: hypothetical protein IKG85_00730 [Clostridia bacterium]|nr:hypothetical protein [Clostridia bacterium]